MYQGSRRALGAPTREFVAFFESFDTANAWVLDIGCGQGRDALHIARCGHRVTGVDISKSGIRQLREEAEDEGLSVEAVVADVRSFVPARDYDVIVVDRTLHMLDEGERIGVLGDLLHFTAAAAVVLIADERSNMAAFERVFEQSELPWTTMLKKSGLLFVRRQD